MNVGIYFIAVFLSGCAAMINTPTKSIYIHSNPDDSEIVIDGYTKGRTPSIVYVNRQSGNEDIVQLKKDGYEQTGFMLNKSINPGWLIWDVGTCLIPVMLCIPLVVDGVTGSWIDVESEYNITMKPITVNPNKDMENK